MEERVEDSSSGAAALRQGVEDRPGTRLFVKHQLRRARQRGAVCLDGSPAAYYLRNGTGDGLLKWLVVLEGGAWCSDLKDCSARLGTDFGSSWRYVKTRRKMVNVKPMYMSDRPEYNRMMWNWNHVFLRSCDGGAWLGGRERTAEYGGAELHFRGRDIMQAFSGDLLDRHPLREATDVVMLGITAASAAIFTHCDPMANRIFSALEKSAPRPRIACVIDNGLEPPSEDVVDFPKFADLRPAGRLLDWYDGLDAFVRLQNATANAKCLAATGGKTRHCLSEFAARYVETPIFAFQGLHDDVHLERILGMPTDVEAVNSWIQHVTAVHRRHMLEAAPGQWRNAMFLHNCRNHTWSGSLRADSVLQTTALEQWYREGSTCRNVWIGDAAYPCPKCCAFHFDTVAPAPRCTRRKGLWAQPPAEAPPAPPEGPNASEGQGPYAGADQQPALEEPGPAIDAVGTQPGPAIDTAGTQRGLHRQETSSEEPGVVSLQGPYAEAERPALEEPGPANATPDVVFPAMVGAFLAGFLVRHLASKCPHRRWHAS